MQHIKKLSKVYNKRIKTLSKNCFESKNTGILLFIEHLKYIRDTLILESQEPTSAKVATLVAAIAEFEAYKKSAGSQRTFHWNNFCELLKHNMEEWLESNDSI